MQVGERDGLDVRGVAAECGEAVEQGTAAEDAEGVLRGSHRQRADAGVDEQGAAVAFHEQAAVSGEPRSVSPSRGPRRCAS